MTAEPILLFLHGVGDGDQDDKWKSRLEGSLVGLGYPDLDSVRVLAPKFAHALKGADEKTPLPPLTVKRPAREAGKQNRRDFERRIGAIEFRLGRHNPGSGVFIDPAVSASVKLPQFKQARNYLTDPKIRAQVLNKILARLPQTGRIVIVGHSLGSIIAADLIRRLPIGLDVVGMVTIGSPLAHAGFDVDKLRESLREPPTNLGWWVNFWNVPDLVAAHRGVSSVFPWMVDFRINTKVMVSKQAHSAVEYLGDDSVAEAIGFALFGSRSKELKPVETGADVPPDATELLALLALRFAHLISLRLDGDRRDRFVGALRSVQAAVVDEIVARNSAEGRTTPSAVARLAFDLSDPNAAVPEPQPSRYFTKDEAVVVMTILASENLVRPFEISIPRDKLQLAMQDLTAETGLGGQYGMDVFTSARRAHEAVSNRGVNLLRLGALGAGAALIVMATTGLGLGVAAGAGLAGAAVLAGGRRTFVPGGMIDGLLTAGAVVTARGGGIASVLASPGTSAETLEVVAERLISAEILRKTQYLDSDPAIWRTLVETEVDVRREHERLDEFSDESAPRVKELKQKIQTIERALKYLRDHGLEPGVPREASEVS